MQVNMAFGLRGLDLDLPDGPTYSVVHAQSATALRDVDAALAAALDHPIGSPSLLQLASGKRSAAISVCDITRPAPNPFTLPPLLSRLHLAGIPEDRIVILIATGLHRPATDDEIKIILGTGIAGRYRVVNHDAKADADHRSIGSTARGTPVAIDRRFLDADLHITLGFIEQHLMLGFSGGRKLVAPGLAAQETIKAIHSPRFMREALATEGSTKNNPLHDELLEIARMARHDFILDVTLTQTRSISGVFAGDPVSAHAAGVAALQNSALQLLPRSVDAVMTSAAGFPLDLTFYQTIKGITAVQHILKPGAPILVLSECSEGIGSPEFASMLQTYAGPQEFLNSIRDTPVQVDQWQLEKLALVAAKHPILYYTPGVPPDRLGALARSTFESPAAAVASLLRSLPPAAHIAVIPDGPYTYARVAGHSQDDNLPRA